MDEMVVSGTVAFIVLYPGIALVIYGIVRLIFFLLQAALGGDYFVLGEFVAGVAGAVIAYVLIGLWLRRIEMI